MSAWALYTEFSYVRGIKKEMCENQHLCMKGFKFPEDLHNVHQVLQIECTQSLKVLGKSVGE